VPVRLVGLAARFACAVPVGLTLHLVHVAGCLLVGTVGALSVCVFRCVVSLLFHKIHFHSDAKNPCLSAQGLNIAFSTGIEEFSQQLSLKDHH
jgi:hypothetical protein